MNAVVVVESPAKAKTINKYLGSGYTVLASYGHIRDLPAKDGSVDPDDDFAMKWIADPRAEKQIKQIASAVRNADRLFLATDPDREGEAISWHIRNVLAERKALAGVDVKRIVFNEITKNAVLDAIANPRNLDQPLIDAYLARRALDYLVGFTLSPVLWRKLPGSRSAGRVQSVALRLISEREAEIEAFVPREYWTVEATLATAGDKTFTARLTHLDGKKLDRFDLATEAEASRATRAIEGSSLAITSIERKTVGRNPQPPFTTSTLQQEASRKLGFGASRTMQLAQRLYEGVEMGGETVGLITYMRTDGVQMANEALDGIRSVVRAAHGDRYLPPAPRRYKSRAKNAQEAHEAIRPTDASRLPSDVARFVDRDMARLYELVWTRAVASQMASAVLDRTTVDIAGDREGVALRATGTVIKFDGFLKLYEEGLDDPTGEDEDGRVLPPMNEGDGLGQREVKPEQHFTQPPPRYSEASLVKRLEELGIGRPSTYASILQVLQDRNYVRLDRRRFVPEDRGRVVTAFLSNFFARYVEYSFTADLENELDEISGGKLDWRKVLRDFWRDFNAAVDETKDLRTSEVLDALNDDLAQHFFPRDENGAPTRACPKCSAGQLSLKLGRFGAFIGCSNYPECRFTRQLTTPTDGDGEEAGDGLDEPKLLGPDPESGLDVTMRRGPYGVYVQLGEASTEKKAPKPKRASLPKGMAPASVDLERALALLSLPREIGPHPDSRQPVLAGIGRFGPYVRLDSTYVSIPQDEDVLTIGLNRAVDLLANAKTKRTAAKELGTHKGKPVTLHAGRFGPYVQRDKTRATIPRKDDADAITLERAIEIIEAKEAKGGPAGGSAGGSGSGSASGSGSGSGGKAAAKTKKPAAKKTAAKGKAASKTKSASKAPSKAGGAKSHASFSAGEA